MIFNHPQRQGKQKILNDYEPRGKIIIILCLFSIAVLSEIILEDGCITQKGKRPLETKIKRKEVILKMKKPVHKSFQTRLT